MPRLSAPDAIGMIARLEKPTDEGGLAATQVDISPFTNSSSEHVESIIDALPVDPLVVLCKGVVPVALESEVEITVAKVSKHLKKHRVGSLFRLGAHQLIWRTCICPRDVRKKMTTGLGGQAFSNVP